MKVCFLIDDFSAVGGIQRVVSLISSGLCDSNEVHVLSMYQEHGNNNKDLYDPRVKLSTLIQGKKQYIKQCFKMTSLIKKYLKENRIDLLIATSEMLSPYSLLSTKTLKIPYICWTHSTAFRYNEAKTQRLFKWLAMRTASRIVALTETICKELVVKYKNSNVICIPNPIDQKLMKDINYNIVSKKIISVGRLCYEKYYEKLIEVAAIVLSKHQEITWDIYGDGIERNNIEMLIKKNNLQGKVNLKGNVNNLYDLYDKYSMLVMTSRSEAFPMALLEGMASGLPLIGFGIPSVKEMIVDNINGMIIKPFDEIEMAKKIEELLKDDDRRSEMSKHNLEIRKNYSIDRVVEKWNELFILIGANKGE